MFTIQTLNAISRRFQNVRAPGGRDPLAHLEIDPLRPLNGVLWGYIQDEWNRLSVQRRAYEYDHQYGLPIYGRAVPGLPNLHSHTFQRAMAGLAERRGPAADSFWTWREVMYGFLERLTPEDVEAIAAQAMVEMLEGGFTHVAEFHYLHHAPDGTPYADPAEMAVRIGAAAAETGIGLTILPVLYTHGGFGAQPPAPGQRRFVNGTDAFLRLVERTRAALPGAITGIAPHSLRAATGEQITEALRAHPHGPVHIHVAEQVAEVEQCLAWCGQRPVQHLLATLRCQPGLHCRHSASQA